MTTHTRQAALLAATLALLLAPANARAGGWEWPVRGPMLTPFATGPSPYARGQHRGVDIGARPGTTVRAAAAGLVRFAGRVGSSGLVVSVRTADGRHDVSYLHLARVDVRAGQRVAAGERLGTVGTSGRRSHPSSHLHLGVRRAGTRDYLDPLLLLPPRGANGRAGEPASGPLPAAARRRGPRTRPLRGRRPRPRRATARAGAASAAPGGAPSRLPAGSGALAGAPGAPPVPASPSAPLRGPRPAPTGAPAPAARRMPPAPPRAGAREAPASASPGVPLERAAALLGLAALAAALAPARRARSPRRRPGGGPAGARLRAAQGRE